MKKTILTAVAVFLCAGFAFADGDSTGTTTTVTGNGVEFEPIPQDLGGLDHSYYYTWGIDWQLPQNEVITSATLSFLNINNSGELDDFLYVNLLDSAPWGVTAGYDGAASGNAFEGNGWLLTTYTDADESTPENFSYPFDAAQLSLLSGAIANDGNFGFGFDPDCHYTNDGVKLALTTRVVPEPLAAELFLCGGGILSFVIGRKKKRSA
ncbi:MAG: hypothetical protein PHT59_06140 [Candidatus Omnitrophica bacterium]|nr:hypothetical protein [Candidatus Omnitrophota bacterium]